MESPSAIFVTGGTGVLGSALVRVLAARGAPVAAGFAHDRVRAERLQSETGCGLIQGDVASEEAVCRIFAGSKFSAVVHCAGVNQDRLLLRENPATFAAALQAHATSAFLISRSGLQMLPRGGQIVLVGSRTGERGGIGQCAYAAAKAATVGLMRTASREGMAAGISVNAVYPGFTPSGLSSGMRDSALVGRERENLLEGAEAAPSFAAFVAWLLEKPRGTGQIFRPDCRG